MPPRPFTIQVPDAVLADLRERLARTRWPDEAPDAGCQPREAWKYGSDLAYVKSLCAYWRETYDWRVHERALNAFPQFVAPIAGIDLHFLHVPGVGPKPLPLLISHGWPGSIVEFHKIIPMLTDPARFGGDPKDAFTVVAPSLPGYGFSFRPGQKRFGIPMIADAFAELMSALGYARFGAHGGDWGSFISARLAATHARRLTGLHVTLMPVRRDGRPEHATPEDHEFLARVTQWMTEENGYGAIQGSKPQTLAYGLTDSPAGLAAWIVEKFRTWSDCGGDVERRFTKDELLTNITIYWVTGAIGSSFWPYYARLHDGWPIPDARIEVPTAWAMFPKEIIIPPRALAERAFNLTRVTPMNAGGHFASLEEPGALVADLREFFRPLR
ncbi:MAG: alpha/beta fold hydrolase [Candidatus Rokubacteria bacterium]|nr:alpha/beta fold hydrolase [Candidatus Rokubacteria bacterium]